MRFRLMPLRAVSTVTIFGTALAAVLISAPLISAPAEASISTADTGHSGTQHSSVPVTSGAGAITGIVDGAGGRPLTGACVVASGPDGSGLAVTTSDGRYTLAGLLPGGYTLRYSACAARGEATRSAIE